MWPAANWNNVRYQCLRSLGLTFAVSACHCSPTLPANRKATAPSVDAEVDLRLQCLRLLTFSACDCLPSVLATAGLSTPSLTFASSACDCSPSLLANRKATLPSAYAEFDLPNQCLRPLALSACDRSLIDAEFDLTPSVLANRKATTLSTAMSVDLHRQSRSSGPARQQQHDLLMNRR